jgi:hemoglobin
VSYFEELGGEEKLRAIIDEFVDRLFDDLMIGFFFAKANRERIKRFEYQHAAEFLGAPVKYEGRPLAVAHRAHRIMGGQFLRRKEILRQTLLKHEVPEHIIDAWLAHVESLRPLITSDPGGECIEK